MKIEEILPEFVEMVKSEAGDKILFHHSAFNENEHELLGAAIKYATLNGKNVEIISDQYPDEQLNKKMSYASDTVIVRNNKESIVLTKN